MISPREVEVVRLIAAGRSTREIAAALSIAEGTVERHLTNLYGKIGVRNRAEATSYAHRHGLVE
ncbi:MAG TPA: LuxR C-terminal-related transcriptional regulator [Dehalococcoidia bacterium]|nr:LuxR C-terminal-related transcriptional regulator [Dehalococcoidia bacterium]